MNDNILNKKFGALLRRHRKKAKLTQEDLSAKCNISRTSITNIEIGNQQATLSTILRFANALNINPSELMPETDDEISEILSESIEKKIAKENLTEAQKQWIRAILAKNRKSA